MADPVSFILDYFHEAAVLEEQGNAANAARLYRITDIYSQAADFFGAPSNEVQECLRYTYRNYKRCLKLLDKAERKTIRMEFKTWFNAETDEPDDWEIAYMGDWRGFIVNQYLKVHPQA